ncbi:MAG: hypothetical protein O6945_08655, partial [Gammaproteobacteria bacterium]|nr:hypothetical protein [Gammaproteobacteria bacterium]
FFRRAIAGEFVRDYKSGRATLPLHQFHQKTHRRLLVLALLYQHIKHIPEPTAFAPLMGKLS